MNKMNINTDMLAKVQCKSNEVKDVHLIPCICFPKMLYRSTSHLSVSKSHTSSVAYLWTDNQENWHMAQSDTLSVL